MAPLHATVCLVALAPLASGFHVPGKQSINVPVPEQMPGAS